jgi:ABC-2 type transport system ATP-binding protein
MLGDYAIEIRNVHKRYGNLHVLRGINLTVPRGEAFGLLGPNGAGKSTLTHTVLGLLIPDEGTIKVFGQTEIERLSRHVGYLPERPRYHTQFTGREYLALLGKLSDLRGAQLYQRVEAVLDLVGILDAADRRIGTYSKGMLQRLGVAQAVLHDPQLLIVDEPGSGLDPGGQHDMTELLQRIRQAGHTIFICTHQLTEVARLCDRVGVLTNGRLDHVSALDDLRAQGHSVTIRVQDLPAETADVLGALSPHIRCTRNEIVIFPVTMQLQAQALRTLLDDGVAVISVIPEADALEQFYLRAVREVNQYVDSDRLDGERATQKLEALIHGNEQ